MNELTRAIVRTLNARYQVLPYGLGPNNAATTYPVSSFVTYLVHLRGCAVHVDVARIAVRHFRSCLICSSTGSYDFGQEFGVRCVEVESDARGGDGVPLYDAACAEQALKLVLGGICD